MAEAALLLCSAEPQTLTGRVTYSQDLLAELARRRPRTWPGDLPGARVDCHLHTVASGDSVLTVDELAERAEQAGLDVVCVTDHNVTHAAVAAAERDLGVRVIVGEEIRTPDGDVIGLFLDRADPLRAAAGRGHRPDQGPGRPGVRAASVRPGPVQPGAGAAGAVRRGRRGRHRGLQRQDRGPALNDAGGRTRARQFSLPGGAGSDAHDAPGVGAAYLDMPDFDGPAGFLAALADARVTGEYRDHAPRYPRRPSSL